MFELWKIQLAPIASVSSSMRADPEDSLSNLESSGESHFRSIEKAESLFATE
jgi:hypothetical protein